ncbi:MAG: hypothetical protein ACRELE_12615 [Gemmatimonadales bacterium]
MKTLAVLLLLCGTAFAQNLETMKYAPLPLLLVSTEPGSQSVMPMMFTIENKQQLAFVKADQIKEAIGNGGRPIRYGDVVALLNQASETISKLQAENEAMKTENERLWKLAMKDSPSQPAPTVVVQQPVAQGPSPLEKYVLLRNLLPATRSQNLNVTFSNCTRLPALCAAR